MTFTTPPSLRSNPHGVEAAISSLVGEPDLGHTRFAAILRQELDNDPRPRCYSVLVAAQFSMFKPEIDARSLSMVTTVHSPIDRAMAAI